MKASRLAPLSGAGAVALSLAALIAAGNGPNVHAPTAKIVSFYARHGTAQTVSGVLLSLGALLFLAFTVQVVGVLRGTRANYTAASALSLAGGVVLVVGLTILAGVAVATDDASGHVAGSTLQTLNVFYNDAVFVFLITIGVCAFSLGAAGAVLGGAALPRWLGWLALLVAIVAAIPSHVIGGTLDHIGLFAFGGLGIWTLVVSVLLAARA